ncbi:hypothetical protein ACS0Y6_08790 [Burkholderia gladioli]|uniref:hypothetical protein n=1 Tax=Burkholderia gladioli TaxID=28095 RepID=UPI000A61CFED
MTDLFTLAQGGFFMQDKRLLTLSFPTRTPPRPSTHMAGIATLPWSPSAWLHMKGSA